MRSWMRALLGLLFVTVQAVSGRAATNLATMQPSAIEALQKRLMDAGCYGGRIDGQASEATIAAVKACPDQEPILRIETGMHTARITRISVDSACQLLATTSDDKTIRLWSLPSGNLVRTIRVPIAGAWGGKSFTVALSSNGQYLAFGGVDTAINAEKNYGLYLFDLESGIIKRLGYLKNSIAKIIFSHDDKRIATGLFGHGGIHVFDFFDGQEIMADSSDYSDIVFGEVFAPDGSLVTSSWDGYIRRYGPKMNLEYKSKAPDGAQPFEIALDSSGQYLAIGYYDNHFISVLDANTLSPLVKIENKDVGSGNFGNVAWSSDGQTIWAAGSAQRTFHGQWMSLFRNFSAEGHQVGNDVPRFGSSVTDVTSCGKDIFYATATSQFGRLDSDGALRVLGDRVGSNMQGKTGMAFMISPDATQVRFGMGFGGRDPVLFDLTAAILDEALTISDSLHASTTDGLPITDWSNSETPWLDGRLLALAHTEKNRSLAINPDNTGFVLGADFTLRAFDAAGSRQWVKDAPDSTLGVNISTDGRIVVAAHNDGTIRWYRREDGRELLSLFVNVKTKGWIAWTETGYYMASPGAEDMIGWHVNRGWEQEADFFPASRFKDRFNRPDVVQRILTTLDENEALKQADEAAHRPTSDVQPLIEHLPPIITILSPTADAIVQPGLVDLRYDVRLPSGGALSRIEAFVDGAKVEARGLAPASDGETEAKTTGTVTLQMPAHDATVSLVAYGANGKAGDAAVLRLQTTASSDDVVKPNLYALLIGITNYDDKRYNLNFPARDAEDLAAVLQEQEGKLYSKVNIKVLTDKDATTTSIKRGLSWLRRQTTAHDLALVFAAGHGTTDPKGKFWFLSSDMDPEDIEATAVSQDDIENILFDLPGKKLLFLDACHSGAALNTGARGTTNISAAVSDFAQAEGGVVAYAASTGREFSFERDEWGHGAFTKALIEGLSGKADLLHKGTVTTATLDLFLEQRVKELTDGRQHPVMTRPKTVPDFPIASVQEIER